MPSLAEEVRELFKGLNSPEWWDRSHIIKRLREYPEELYLPLLEEALRDHENDTLRNGAMEFYRVLGSRGVPSLGRLLKDRDDEVRVFAATLLGEIGDPSAVPLLIEALNDPAPNVRASAVEAVGRLGAPEAVEPLKRMISDEPWVAMAAIKAMADIGTEEALQFLYTQLTERCPYASMVLEVLETSGGEEAIEFLLPLLNESPLRELAVKALVGICRREGIRLRPEDLQSYLESLLELYRSAQEDVSRAAFLCLCWGRHQKAIPVYVEALQDEDLQEYAIEALLEVGEGAVPHLLEILRDTTASQRPVIARLLLQLGGYTGLKEFMDDPDPEVRTEVALALGFLDEPEARQLLQMMTEDPEEEVRMAAKKSLQKKG